ncbi:hypothetical protein IJD44_05775 [bacterium]|nr:hypothetical protein [bacterium]
MKNFVVKYGGFIVNIVAFFTLIGVLFSGIMVMMNQGMWAGLLSLWGGIVAFVVAFFMIYLVMSINDNLREMNSKTNSKYN